MCGTVAPRAGYLRGIGKASVNANAQELKGITITGFFLLRNAHRNLSLEPEVWEVPGRVPGWLLTHVYFSRGDLAS